MEYYVWIIDSPKIQTKGVVYTEVGIRVKTSERNLQEEILKTRENVECQK